MDTFLQIVNSAEMELGLPVSASVFGNINSSTTGGITDNTGTQLGALANRVLDEMRRMNPIGWTALQFEYDLIVQVPITVTGTLQALSPVITNISPNTTGILPYVYQVSGPGIPVASRVLSVDSPTQITMTMENTNTSIVPGATLLFPRDTYPMPVGFDWFQNRTMWDRTNRWELLGPDSPQMDQWHRSGIVVTGPRRHFRQLGPGGNQNTFANEFRIWPAPYEIVSPLQLVFEYLSNAAVQVAPVTIIASFVGTISGTVLTISSVSTGVITAGMAISGIGVTAGTVIQSFGSGTGGTGTYNLNFSSTVSAGVGMSATGGVIPGSFAVKFANDNDTPLLDDQALIMGIKWMFWEIKGFGSYVTLQQRWVDYVQRLIGRDGGAPTLNIVKRINPIFISPANVQDGFYPGPVGANMG